MNYKLLGAPGGVDLITGAFHGKPYTVKVFTGGIGLKNHAVVPL